MSSFCNVTPPDDEGGMVSNEWPDTSSAGSRASLGDAPS
jgi:hypothetical protein